MKAVCRISGEPASHWACAWNLFLVVLVIGALAAVVFR